MSDVREQFLYRLATTPPRNAEAIVVLAGEDAEPRYKVGLQLFAQRAAPFVVVSGGIADPPSKIPATTLRERLIGAGMSPDRIIVDDQANHTYEQAVNVVAIAMERGWKTLILVASPYHAPRAFLTFLAELQRQNLADSFRLVTVMADQTNWDASPAGLSITRAQLFDLELSKIDAYAAKGHVATYEQGLAYLSAWSGK